MEYDSANGGPHPENDWYQFVEYGTMNQQSIYWQKCGFSREAAIYLLNPKNYPKYVIEENGVKKLRRTILECGNPIVEGDADRVQYNMPELFTD